MGRESRGAGQRGPSRPRVFRGHISDRVRVAKGPAGAPPKAEERGSNDVMTAVATQEIPLVDLKAQYATIRDEVRSAIDEVLESMQLTIGPNVKAFDNEFASYIGTGGPSTSSRSARSRRTGTSRSSRTPRRPTAHFSMTGRRPGRAVA